MAASYSQWPPRVASPSKTGPLHFSHDGESPRIRQVVDNYHGVYKAAKVIRQATPLGQTPEDQSQVRLLDDALALPSFSLASSLSSLNPKP